MYRYNRPLLTTALLHSLKAGALKDYPQFKVCYIKTVNNNYGALHHVRVSGAINCKVYLVKCNSGNYELIKTGVIHKEIKEFIHIIKEQAIKALKKASKLNKSNKSLTN